MLLSAVNERNDIALCQGTEPEKTEESTEAATESVPEPEDPLTPDGNLEEDGEGPENSSDG